MRPLSFEYLNGLTAVALLLAASVSCAEDPEALTYTVHVSCNPTELFGDGSNSATCSVQVLDQHLTPAETGTRIAFFGRDEANPTVESGAFGPELDSNLVRYLGGAGDTTTEFTCTEVATVLVFAQLETQERGVATVNCLNLTGDWVIESLTPGQAGLRPGDRTTVTAVAHTADGEPVTPGTQIVFETTASHGGFGSSHAASAVDGTNASGEASVNFVASSGTYTETANITARFENANLGESQKSTSITVDADLPENTVRCPDDAITLLADGTSTTDIVCTVFEAGAAVAPDVEVFFTIAQGSGSLSDAGRATSDSSGQVTVTYTSGVTFGNVRIEAEAPSVGTGVLDTVLITLADVGEVEFLGCDTSPLGIADSGVNEQGECCFLVNDHNGTPFTIPLAVEFDTGGSSSAGALVVPVSAESDSEGVACTSVHSGTTAGTVVVNACATVGSTPACGQSTDIPVVGVVPSRGGMSLTCAVRNIGALRYQQGDEIREPDTGSLCTTCELRLTDRDSNPVGFERTVTFAAESGGFRPSAQTTNDLNGVATVTWCADGNLPTDVYPMADEPNWEDTVGSIQNPRDGLVSIIAYVSGEEEFEDINLNGQWDQFPGPGENPSLFPERFWDQPEPFVDSNDNNQYQPELENERHIDIAGGGRTAGVHDPANGVWDGDSDMVIWVQTRVLLTGAPAFDDDGTYVGSAEEPPTELELDSDYPDPARLSHWYVLEPVPGGSSIEHGNYYPTTDINDACAALPDSCFLLPADWSDDNPYDVYFVARDQNGNPLNGSLTEIGYEFNRTACDSAISVELVEYDAGNAPGSDFPFDLEFIRQGTVMDYEVRLSNFRSGSYQLFELTPGGDAVFTSKCHFEMTVPLTACSTCGDSADDDAWPFLILDKEIAE